MIWRWHNIQVFLFYFVLEPTVRKQLDENDSCHCYGIFFRKCHSETTWSSYVQISVATTTRHFENGIWIDILQLKISRIWITIWTNFFSSKYLQIKIGGGAWKMITYTIIRACSSKNITPKHFTYYCMLLFLSNKPSL